MKDFFALNWQSFRGLTRSPFGQKLALLVGGTALAQLLSIGVLPLVTRLYSPREFGIIAIFLSFFGYWASNLSLRYDQAIVIAVDDSESHIIQRIATMNVVIMSIAGALILCLMQRSNLLDYGILPDWAPVASAFIFLFFGLFSIYRSWALRAGFIRQISQASLYRSSVNALSRVALGLAGWGVLGLFVAELLSAIASVPHLYQLTANHYANNKPVHSDALIFVETAKKYSKFALIDAPSTWVDALAFSLPVPIVAFLYGPESAGFFALARTLVAAPNSQIGAAVADLFQAELAKAIHLGDFLHARRLFRKLLKKLILIGLLPLLLFEILAPWLMPVVFGPKWVEAGKIVTVISPWFYVALVISPLSRATSVLQTQEVKLIYDLLSLALIIAISFYAKVAHLNLLSFLVLLSAFKILEYVVFGFLLERLMAKYLSA